jgi:Holliday junction resolvase RusA-like endonuclease
MVWFAMIDLTHGQAPEKVARFFVPGKPVSKARPRVTRKGYAYTPKDTVEAEKLVRESYLTQCIDFLTKRPIFFEGDIEVEVVFRLPDKRRRDLDNLYKTITDALNGVAYPDDSQIHSALISKIYGGRIGSEVCIREWMYPNADNSEMYANADNTESGSTETGERNE